MLAMSVYFLWKYLGGWLTSSFSVWGIVNLEGGYFDMVEGLELEMDECTGWIALGSKFL